MPEKNRQLRVVKMSEQEDAADLRKTTTPQERLEIMWQLSQNAWAFKGEPIAEPGLHRHIVRVLRRKS
jgi:hypothetical protein